MIKILDIGNSFSQDATHYIHQIAAADNVDIKVVNLYIGGCSLERHWNNIQNETEGYLLEENGYSTGAYVSVQQALAMEEWDYVVTQQVSQDSGFKETYEPYLKHIIEYIKGKLPNVKILLHETWAYEMDSLQSGFKRYNYSQQEMYNKLSSTYKQVAKEMELPLIPCGDVIQEIRKNEPFLYEHGGMSICRDGFHMNVIYGRYLLAATWYKIITGNAICKKVYNTFKERGIPAMVMPAGLRTVEHLTSMAGADMTFSLQARVQNMVNEADPERVLRIDDEIPAETIRELYKIPEFVKAYEEGGLKPEEFITFGVTQKTMSQFLWTGWVPLETYQAEPSGRWF